MGREPKVLREAHEHNCFAHRVQHGTACGRQHQGLDHCQPKSLTG